MSEEYHTPKDLVNKEPLSVGLQVLKKSDIYGEAYNNIEPIQKPIHSRAADESSDDVSTQYLFNLIVVHNCFKCHFNIFS